MSKVVIVGGGIVGISTAYFLAKYPNLEIVLVERHSIACAASGKAGGFLAKDWAAAYCDDLHEKGFELHEYLAKELNIESFRYLSTLGVSSGKSQITKPSFLNGKKVKTRKMDDHTAQVTPGELCAKMFAKAESSGVRLVIGKATSIDKPGNQLIVDNETKIPYDHLVLCMGPWSCEIEEWLDGIKVPMEGIKSSSIVVTPESTQVVDGVALFCDEDTNGCHLEVYPRPDNTVYLCGLGHSPHLDKNAILALEPDMVLANEERVHKALQSFENITVENFLSGSTHTTQACMRPCLTDARPIIGRLPGSNIYVGTGHNCWGILWGPITGQVLAELIIDETPSINLAPFNPLRFSK